MERPAAKESLPVKEYDIYIPLAYNDGSPVEPRKLMRLRERLLEQFGGVTFFPQANEGFWTFAGVTYRDDIVVFRVITDKVRTARRVLKQLKEELKRDLKQEEILIVEKDAELL
jgi:hypothetical protein